jgi:hypothetical protein
VVKEFPKLVFSKKDHCLTREDKRAIPWGSKRGIKPRQHVRITRPLPSRLAGFQPFPAASRSKQSDDGRAVIGPVLVIIIVNIKIVGKPSKALLNRSRARLVHAYVQDAATHILALPDIRLPNLTTAA